MRRFIDFLSRQSRGTVVLGFTVYWAVVYMTTNHYPLRSSSLLPFFPYETVIPFIGWTILVYLSAFPQAVSVAWLLDREALAWTTAAAYVVVTGHALTFAVLPTSYPRTADPPVNPQLFDALFKTLYFADSPRNCFPSLHVAMATLLGLAVWHQRRRLGAVYLCWTFLIILSTLTTKQHYAVDALGGAAIAVAAYYFAFNRTKRPIPESSASLR